jgi:hypothetical protein
MIRRRPTLAARLSLAGMLALSASAEAGDQTCPAARSGPLLPTDPDLCRRLAQEVREPSRLPLDAYEVKLGHYLRNFCHRDSEVGWQRDKGVRDTGPFAATLVDGAWQGQYYGTHAPVVIWYSPEMLDWLRANRADGGALAEPAPVPAGAIMVKEMYPVPAAACAGVEDVTRLLPTSGAAVMVRDPAGSKDGWYWGWFGWSDWDPDWPAGPSNRLPYQGFGQYCVNCHASAADNLTFADLKNVEGEPGEPLVFLSQHWFDANPPEPHHRLVALPDDDAPRLGQPHARYDLAFTDAIGATSLRRPTWESVVPLPSETYDNVWMPADGPNPASQYLTSDQCLGCHDAGGTGLQFDMTMPNPNAAGDGAELLNLSPYATWRTSPMGLGGRDPIFYAQLASETETFHPAEAEVIPDICLGCHGVLGQRQHGIDTFEADGSCAPFSRELVDAVPWPADAPAAANAKYGALARDGISCTACHHMVLGDADSAANRGGPQNHCVDQRQALLNPDNTGFARTFTGSFLVGPPDRLYGPFEDPTAKPMQHALGIEPAHYANVELSELCGTCHTVHLPVLHEGRTVAHVYEQTTYPEWAFSAYRTGKSADGDLPLGPGGRAQSCQGCHMPSAAPDGTPYRSKIAGIQEHSGFPEIANGLPPEDINLDVREGFARHTLVGLNVFFIKMAQQFPDVLGIRTQDPMLVDQGLDPLLFTEQAMLDQAAGRTATVAVEDVTTSAGKLQATVRIDSLTGHKFPSGVGFRRAFVEFAVLDAAGRVLWASGRTDEAGIILDGTGAALPGELWWQDDCSARIDPLARTHQPHYQTITAEDQVQIYQELVSTPAPSGPPNCGHEALPEGQLTTSFLSICAEVKDNRILPHGYLDLDQRLRIAEALGAGRTLAEDAGSTAVGDDPDYVTGGGDRLVYEIDLAGLDSEPAAVRATLYYQAIPPFYLQDRFCSADSEDTERLYFLAGHLNLDQTPAEHWKLAVAGSGVVPVTHHD